MMRIRLLPLLLLATLVGCAGAPQERDAVGNPRLERLDAQALAAIAPVAPVRLTLEQVIALSHRGVPAEAINDRMFRTASRFDLADADRASLRRQGVDEQVIAFIDSVAQDARRIDAETRQAAQDAQARRNLNALGAATGYWDPFRSAPGAWSPRVFPYGGYGWSRWGSGWYGGVGIGF